MPWLTAAVFSVALLVRTAYLLSIGHAPFFTHLQTEPARYDAWALAIASGARAHPPFDESPAYPYLISAVYAIGGHNPFAVASLQALLDAASCTACAAVAMRFGGARSAWAAGMLAAVYGPMIYFTGQIEPATLAVFAVALALLATPSEGASPHRWLLAGMAWTAAMMARPETAVALVAVFVHAWRSGGTGALVRAGLAPAALVCASLAVNWASSGHAVILTTGAGVNMWLGYNQHADGVSPFLDPALAATARAIDTHAHGSVEADELFRARALAFIAGDPGRAAHLALRKAVWLFSARELPNASDIAWQTAQSWLFRALPVLPLGFGAVLPAATAGAILLGRRWHRALYLAGPPLVAIVVAVVFFTNARFRMVLAPTLLVLAGVGVDRAIDAARRRDVKHLALGALGAGLAALTALSNFDGIRGYRIPEIDMNTAELEAGAGQFDAAVARLRGALTLRPDDAAGWAQLAATLERAGRTAEARDARAHARGTVAHTSPP